MHSLHGRTTKKGNATGDSIFFLYTFFLFRFHFDRRINLLCNVYAVEFCSPIFVRWTCTHGVQRINIYKHILVASSSETSASDRLSPASILANRCCVQKSDQEHIIIIIVVYVSFLGRSRHSIFSCFRSVENLLRVCVCVCISQSSCICVDLLAEQLLQRLYVSRCGTRVQRRNSFQCLCNT